MANTNYQSVDEYISLQPKKVQVLLVKLRGVIKKLLPDATEIISYQIPAFKVDGRYVIYFAGWKKHVSLYPIPRGTAAFRKAINPFVKGKGTISFSLDKPLPMAIIKDMVKYCLLESTRKES